MKITSAEFIISNSDVAKCPQHNLPEYAFIGRSNVGKSSLINMLTNRKNLAKTSGKPGKTQTLNFYLVNEAFYFVDVPGYGYAKVSKKDREAFGQMIEEYLLKREQLKIVIQLVDFRHKPSEDDVLMYQFLSSYNIPTIVIGTKVDKVPKTKRKKNEKVIMETLGLEEGMFLPYSGITKLNINEVHDLLDQIVEG